MFPTTRQIATAVLVFACGLIVGGAVHLPDPPEDPHQVTIAPPPELHEKYRQIVEAWRDSQQALAERDTEIRFLREWIEQIETTDGG
jgi:hypothetical protein